MHKLVQGDSASQIKVTLTREDTGLPVDMTTKTSLLKFKLRGTSTILFELTGSNIVPADGTVLFAFNSNLDTIASGYYEGEVEVTNLDTTTESVFELISFQVREDF